MSVMVGMAAIAAKWGRVQWWGTTNLLHCVMESWVLRVLWCRQLFLASYHFL